MKRFGQEVKLTIQSKDGVGILDASGLRIDFDYRQLPEFSRAKVTIYNLNSETIGNLIGGDQDHYLTLSTRLHGGQEFNMVDGFYISNSMDYKKVPDTITSLYCYSGARRDFFEKPVSAPVHSSSLTGQLQALKEAVKWKGEFKPLVFPEGLMDAKSKRPASPMNGTFNQILRGLANEYGFRWYVIEGDIHLVYKPSLSQVKLTDLDDKPVITLDTNNMRANPKLSPAQLQINSNLDGDIQPGAVLDVTKLLTAEANVDDFILETANNYARDSVSGYSKFLVLDTVHKGSNYTGDWNTLANCVSPQTGTRAPVGATWFQRLNRE